VARQKSFYMERSLIISEALEKKENKLLQGDQLDHISRPRKGFTSNDFNELRKCINKYMEKQGSIHEKATQKKQQRLQPKDDKLQQEKGPQQDGKQENQNVP
jgi:hypothetical protein